MSIHTPVHPTPADKTLTHPTRSGEGTDTSAAVTIAAMDPTRDSFAVHRWLSHPRARYWQMTELDEPAVRGYLEGIRDSPDDNGWIGSVDGVPTFYVETYAPVQLIPAEVVPEEPGDIGMHLLIAPPDGQPVHGFTDRIMAEVVDFCLRPHSTGGRGGLRVIVEPDVGNTAIIAKNRAAGFRAVSTAEVSMGEATKTALVSVCTREDFAAGRLAGLLAARTAGGAQAAHGVYPQPSPVYPHLSPGAFARATRHLVAKAISEFAHERLIAPVERGPVECVPVQRGGVAPTGATEPVGDAARKTQAAADWTLTIPLPEAAAGERTDDTQVVRYEFSARVLPLEHWLIDEDSIVRFRGRQRIALDAQELIVELQDALGIPETLLSTYLEEVASTLAGGAFKLTAAHAGRRPDSAQLLDADFQTIEAAMTEGHPGFIANNGRIGFGLTDYRKWAPETGRKNRIEWVAARREHAHLSLGTGLDEATHLDWALSADERRLFTERIAAAGGRAEDYHLLPIHPWQADHRLAITFAADIARGDLLPLGRGLDEFQAQQSLRTFFNHSRANAPYVKVALAVQNMGFLRGLSPKYMRDTPAINDWVAGVIGSDPLFAQAGFRILRERSALGYTGDVYHHTRTENPQRKMLAALWRENPLTQLGPGQRTMTMAALLHRDHQGVSFASRLIRASGLRAEDWLSSYLHAYLHPLVHALLAHDLVFMPHGENLILILESNVVTGAFMKDIGEEVAVLGNRELPERVERIRALVPGTEKALSVFTDMFDGVLRHLAAILDADGVVPVQRFWSLVAEVLDRYESEHPDHARGLSGDVDLRVGRFAHSCLNRLQLRNTTQMVDIGNQAESLMYAGTLRNPVARF